MLFRTETDRQTDRQTDRHIDRQRHRQRHRHRERKRQRQRQRDTERETERQSERRRERGRFFKSFLNELVFFSFYIRNIFECPKIWNIGDFEYGSMITQSLVTHHRKNYFVNIF